MEEKELIKKLSSLFEESKKRKIVDFDGGLLNDVYEPITGSAEEKFDKWSDRLIRVATRLENLSKKGKQRPEVLDDIYDFFENLRLPHISPCVKDDSITIKYGRTIQIDRGDDKEPISCPSELFNDTAQKIRQEQYVPLIAKVKVLFARAMAELKGTEFMWHRDGLIREIRPDEEENNGG
ncbi:hypothetical protein KA005_81535 [bacterium]|nr:hypothetical protein [bacterium]